DVQVDWDYVEKNQSKYSNLKAGEVYIVELQADLDERLERNKSPHRLEHKPTKRDIEWSEEHLKSVANKFRLNSFDGEVTRKNYIKINNTNLTAAETAKFIQERFEL
ncbi:hypothetical protein JQK62_18590, partial [Leptospira santarosai]|nr:hypothetical protein [Leptospira santarosai]